MHFCENALKITIYQIFDARRVILKKKTGYNLGLITIDNDQKSDMALLNRMH